MHFSTLTSVHLSSFFMGFSMETITSEPVVDPTHVDWGQECREKNIPEVLQSEDTVLINDLEDEIADDEQDVRKVTASETPDSLDAVKCFQRPRTAATSKVELWKPLNIITKSSTLDVAAVLDTPLVLLKLTETNRWT